jgi:hypothetical protein
MNGDLAPPIHSPESPDDRRELTNEDGEVIGIVYKVKVDSLPLDETMLEWKQDMSAKWNAAEQAGVGAASHIFDNPRGEHSFTNPATGEEILRIENYESVGYILPPQTDSEQDRQIQVVEGKPGVTHGELSRAPFATDMIDENATYIGCRVGTAEFTDGTTGKFAEVLERSDTDWSHDQRLILTSMQHQGILPIIHDGVTGELTIL